MEEKKSICNRCAKEKMVNETNAHGFLKWIAVTFALWAVLHFITPLVAVVGRSMESTFRSGDLVICNALDQSYKQGDVVVFRGSGAFAGGNLIKRIAALPGDVVDMDKNGIVRVNDKTFIGQDQAGLAGGLLIRFPVIVPDGYLFVLGDNQPHSTDSRYSILGMVPMENVIGVVKARIPLSVLMPN